MMEEIHSIKGLIGKFQIEDSIDMFFNLISIFQVDNEREKTILREINNELILISSKYFKLKTDEIDELEIPHVIRIHYNKIVKHLLILVDRFSELFTGKDSFSLVKSHPFPSYESTCLIKIELKTNISDFSVEKQREFIQSLDKMLSAGGKIEIRKIIKGSIIFYVILTEQAAYDLLRNESSEKFKNLEITDASYSGDFSTISKFDKAYDYVLGKYSNMLTKNVALRKIISALFVIILFCIGFNFFIKNSELLRISNYILYYSIITSLILVFIFSKREKALTSKVIKGKLIMDKIVNRNFDLKAIDSPNDKDEFIYNEMNSFAEDIL